MGWALADGAMSGVMSALEVGKGWQMAGGELVRARSIERRARRLLWALRMASSGAAEDVLKLLSKDTSVLSVRRWLLAVAIVMRAEYG